jgi:inorganic triphosphatase YgiF
MATNAEVGLKFLVPAASRAALVAAVAGRGASKPVWQTASAPDAAHADGSEAGMRFQTQLHRLSRRVRTRGAVVEITVDEGRLLAEGAVRRLCEVGFELVSGSPVAMLALAERWRAHFGLVLDPRHKAERGHALACGQPDAPLRKAAKPHYAKDATPVEALGVVLDECLDHIGRSAIGLAEGDPAQRDEHVHQCRVGIRRLRSALKAFAGWVAEPPPERVDGLRQWFAALGTARDRDVLGSGVAADLARAGAPPLALPGDAQPADPAALARAGGTQRLLLAWLSWRTGLAPADAAPEEPLKRLARQRLRRWHKRLVAAARAFDTLDDAALHALRKRIKRQRYAVEFFAPLLPAKAAARHRRALAAAQQSLGRINDLAVARAGYEGLVARDPAAWFAVGWLTARIAEARLRAREELGALVALAPLGR